MLKEILDFHALTKNQIPEDAGARPEPASPAVPYKLYRKAYPRFPIVELAGDIDPSLTLYEALDRRESAREFGTRPLDFSQLCEILSSVRVADAERFPEKRTYASAGALFPVEIYVLAFNVAGLEDNTAYHLNLRINALESLWPIPADRGRDDLVTPDLAGCCAAVVLTSVLSRSAVKYGEKAYPFSYLEAGLILQNLTLACAGADIGASPVGGFIDETVGNVLDLPAEEIPLCVMAIGNKAAKPA